MAVFTVDTDAVAAATAAARSTAERLQAETAALTAHLAQLQASWTGGASAAFQACAEQWRGAQAHVEQALTSISSALASAASHYTEAEQYSAGLFR